MKGGVTKKFLVLLLVGVFFFGNNQIVSGGAYEWGGLGSRAKAMGGAFIGLADDWTAIYWNPAGLTQLEKPEFGVEFDSPHPTLKDGNSVSNKLIKDPTLDTKYQMDTFINYTGLEPARFDKEEVNLHFYLLNGLAYCSNFKGFSIAAGYYAPVGHYIDWEDTVKPLTGMGDIKAKLYQKLGIMVGNISIAKDLHPRFSLGAGINLLYGMLDYNAQKHLRNTGSDYSFEADLKGDGFGLEGIFGALFKITDQLSLGGVYRTGGKIKMSGNASTTLSLAAFPIDEKSHYDQDFTHPATWGIGLAFRPKDNLTLTADFQRTNWSSFRIDVKFDNPGVALHDKDYSADWKDSNRYRVGAEYRPNQRWSLSCGYLYDESPLPDTSVSLTNIVDVDRHSIDVGAGYKWRISNWKLQTDIRYAYSWGDREINDVDYSQRVHSIGATISFIF